MKIAILSRDGTLYSCRRLREAAQQRGHQIEILDPLSCYMNVSPVASAILTRFVAGYLQPDLNPA